MPIRRGDELIRQLGFGSQRVSKGYVGSTLVFSAPTIGVLSIDGGYGCTPAGTVMTLTARHTGTATDLVYSWTKPAGSTAPVAGLTTGTLSWTAADGDDGTYGVTVTSKSAIDSPQTTSLPVNIFPYTAPAFADADANAWIRSVELADCGQLETSVRDAMNQLVVDLKANGYYASATVIHPLIGARRSSALLPLKAPAGWGIATNVYSRRLGLQTNDANWVAVAHPAANLAGAINAGAAGLATYATTWSGDQDPVNVNGFTFCRFACDGTFSSEAGSIDLAVNFAQYNADFLGTLTAPAGRITAGTAKPPAPIFMGAQINGPQSARVCKVRANAATGTQTFSNLPTPNPSTTYGMACLAINNAGFLGKNYYVNHAFLMGGGGPVDYSSDTLRTIITTYVNAVQAAIP